MKLKQRYFKRGIFADITQITGFRRLGNRITIGFTSSQMSEVTFSWRDDESASRRWDSSQSWKNKNISIPGKGNGTSKARTVRGHKEGEFRGHNYEFNFRYNMFALLVRYTGGSLSSRCSLGLVLWSSLRARDPDLGIIFIRIFSEVIEVIHWESGENIRMLLCVMNILSTLSKTLFHLLVGLPALSGKLTLVEESLLDLWVFGAKWRMSNFQC